MSLFSKRNYRVHPFLVDVMTSILSEGGVLTATLLSIGIVGHTLGATILGEYLLLKRVSAWLISGSQLGLGVAVPREIAHCTQDTESHAKRYLAASMIFVTLLVSIVCAGALLAFKPVSHALFGRESWDMLAALGLLVLGTGTYTMLYSYYRGLQRIQIANAVQIIYAGAIPILAIFATVSSKSASVTIGLTGIVGLGLSAIWAFSILVNATGLGLRALYQAIVHLLGYGIRRVPGDFATSSLFALAPLIAVHFVSASEVSFLLMGTACLTAASVAITPLGVVMLTKVSRLFGTGRAEDVRHYIGHLRSAVLQISAFIMVQAVIFAKPVMLWWVGKAAEGCLPVMCISMLAVPGYMYYVAMRSVIDAKSRTAHNAHNVTIALGVFILLAGAAVIAVPSSWLIIALSLCTLITVYVLAILTEVRLRKMDLGSIAFLFQPFVVVGITGGVSLAVEVATAFHPSKSVFVFTILLNAAIAGWMIKTRPPEWVNLVLRVGLGTR